ncbi:CRISPR-associated endonuclease Csn1 [Natranaerovirga pectinivora]|uniref:CRISPR-associated endonuclease Cas9 n=1 Tax=Natranaerovirga pectinivora TaxID=682400 RepID=A0A4R3MK21_9FIRM|nr:type II CRISPR RNA-guided endonuclease Cas9 [Natranaerovirga pectinivora]TCT14551.1 CRISPR-associated endonuclease Csn1 [Natranaerovirga pectinivora]
MKKNERYYVGLDIGTNSVGWAVTDDKYKLYKCNGHKMWGVRLFDEAETAESRRVSRTSRRRLQRRNARIDLFQELMAEEICKVDPGFYQRLEDSKFYMEDKTVVEKHTLFIGDKYNDKDYYSEFPTIFHLRAALIKGEKEYDIRLIYLAIHHILKNRGHFLYQGDKFDTSSSLDESIHEVFDNNDVDTNGIEVTVELVSKIKDVILNERLTKTDKKKKLKYLFGKSKQLESIFGLAIGTKESLEKVFGNPEYKELENDVVKISFSDKVYDEVRHLYEEVLEDRIVLIDNLKKIYDTVLLNGIKKAELSLSESKVELYQKHKEELTTLKKIIKAYSQEEYKRLFSEKDSNSTNYKNYIGDGDKKCSREDFYKTLKALLEKVEDSPVKEYILEEISLDKYLPLQRVKENGVIPYQIHQEELKLILDNASGYLDFLNQTDGKLSVKDKIMKIMTFRIPYYVGPINTYHAGKKNGFAWAVKNSDEKITPWNFDDIIDLEASHDNFIRKMTNKCTYLRGKDVIPKSSLLYSEYTLLNELNNIRCNGEKVSVSTRNKMIDSLFKDTDKKGKVTVKKILEFLKCEGECEGNATITGIDDEVKADLKSYRDFKSVLGEKFNYEMVEDIIKWITLYANEHNSIKKRIKDNYADKLTSSQINKICKLRYKEWGRLSKEFLTEIICDEFTDYSTGEVGNVINAMRNTTNNLMQLLSNKYDYIKQIKEINDLLINPNEEISHEMLDELYVSPGVKRMIWQSILIMEEIKKIMSREPEKIFIETVRSNKANKKRTDTRKKKLLELYSSCKDEVIDWPKEIQGRSDGQLRSKKLYLYYLQMGKCLYTGEKINLDKLMSGEDYDIDHIYPRSKTKDDSFDNLVLVKRVINNEKSDNYPINPAIQAKMKKTWDYLYQKGFISTRKYERLVRKEEFGTNELADFIARQLIETSQSTKAVAEIMQRLYLDSHIIYVKAENVSAFRNDMKFIKVRDINDLHHAKDAYLNIVVGNVFDTKFTRSPANFVKEAGFREYNLSRMYDFLIKRDGYIAWDGRNGDSKKMVDYQMKSNDVRVTRRPTEQKGQLFDLTLHKKGDSKAHSYMGSKTGDLRLADVTKYGGYTSIKIAYLIPYSCDIINKKGARKSISRLTGVPVYLANNVKSVEGFTEYIFSQVPTKSGETIENFKIINVKLRIGSLIKYNGFYYYVGGRTGENFCADNAIQLLLGEDEERYIKEIFKFINNQKENKDLKAEKFSDDITKENNYKLYDALVNKLNSNIYVQSTNNKYDVFNDAKMRNKFCDLVVEEQIKMLLNLLNLLTNKTSTYDFKPLGFGIGRRKLGFNLADVKEFKLINQSITGLFENSLDLLSQL